MVRHSIVEVEWEDSETEDSWVKLKKLDTENRLTCYTVGLLVAESEDMIVVAHSVSEDRCNGIIRIPKRAIVDMFYLTEVEVVDE